MWGYWGKEIEYDDLIQIFNESLMRLEGDWIVGMLLIVMVFGDLGEVWSAGQSNNSCAVRR